MISSAGTLCCPNFQRSGIATTTKNRTMSKDVKQTTHGDQAPIVDTGGGDSTIKYKTVNKYNTKVGVIIAIVVVAVVVIVIVVLSTQTDEDAVAKGVAIGVADLITKGQVDQDEVKAEIIELYSNIKQNLAELKDGDLQKVKSSWEDGKVAEAEKALTSFYEKSLKNESSSEKIASLEFILGSMKLMNLDYAGARDYYVKATQNDPVQHEYWNKLGRVYLKLDEMGFLVADPETIAESNPAFDNDCAPLDPGGAALEIIDNRILAFNAHCKALNLRKKHSNENPDDLDAKLLVADSYDYLGWTSYLLQDGKGAEKFYQDSLDWREPVHEKQPSEVTALAIARSHNGLGNAKADYGELNEAIEEYTKANVFLEPYIPKPDEKPNQSIQKFHAQIKSNSGVASMYEGDCDNLEKAIIKLKEALELHKTWVYNIVRDPKSFEHAEVALSHYNLGLAYWEYGDLENAKKQFEQSKAMFANLPGADEELQNELDNMIMELDENMINPEMEGCEV